MPHGGSRWSPSSRQVESRISRVGTAGDSALPAALALLAGWAATSAATIGLGSVVVLGLFAVVGVLCLTVAVVRLRSLPQFSAPAWTLAAILGFSAAAAVGFAVARSIPTAPSLLVVLGCLVAIHTVLVGFRVPTWVPLIAWLLCAAAWVWWVALSVDPLIDVYQVLQQASQAAVTGVNPYTVDFDYPRWYLETLPAEWLWQHPFPYPPGAFLLLAPFAAAFDDVRWGLIMAAVLVPVALRPLLGWRRAFVAGVLVLAAPGAPAMAVNSWTEPLVLVLLLAAIGAAPRARGLWAVAAMAGVVLVKQYGAVLLAITALWKPIGWKRALLSATTAGLLMLPFALGAPTRFWEGTVTAALNTEGRSDSLSLNGIALQLAWDMPGWLPAIVLLVLLAVLLRPVGDEGRLLLLAATTLGAVVVTSTHAHLNFYWLVVVLVSIACLVLASRTQNVAAMDARPRANG